MHEAWMKNIFMQSVARVGTESSSEKSLKLNLTAWGQGREHGKWKASANQHSEEIAQSGDTLTDGRQQDLECIIWWARGFVLNVLLNP